MSSPLPSVPTALSMSTTGWLMFHLSETKMVVPLTNPKRVNNKSIVVASIPCTSGPRQWCLLRIPAAPCSSCTQVRSGVTSTDCLCRLTTRFWYQVLFWRNVPSRLAPLETTSTSWRQNGPIGNYIHHSDGPIGNYVHHLSFWIKNPLLILTNVAILACLVIPFFVVVPMGSTCIIQHVIFSHARVFLRYAEFCKCGGVWGIYEA